MALRVDRNPGDHIMSIPGSQFATNGSSRIAPGVLVKNARKAYGNRPPILYNFDMNVPRGTIYGLLGSSGCGKTTILSCIVGLRKLDEGKILVCGAKPGTRESGIPGPRVGYMPQDIALYINMTIREILEYYGRIYGMTPEDIEARLNYLTAFLELPEHSRVIGTLSGGQQRRTSLAVALVHQPELLILDEPTVGVDPIVREKIWEHLCTLVRTKKTTVIVTTHYIEECRQAHTVGLMRNGKLLAEKSPNALLEEHDAELLEDIVLKLCRKDTEGQESFGLIEGNPSDEVTQALQEISFYSGNKNLTVGGKKPQPSIAGDKSPIVGLKFKRRYTEENMARGRSLKRQQSVADFVQDTAEEYFYSRADRIKALILRNYITLFRNYVFVFGILLIPAIQLVIIRYVIGYDPKFMEFGIVNHESPVTNGTGPLESCQYEEGCLAAGAGCKFAATLPPESIIMNSFDTEMSALEKVESGHLWGYMSIPPNYTDELKLRALHRNFADNATLVGSTISVKMDMSHYLASSLIIKLLFESYQNFIQGSAAVCEQGAALAELPFKYNALYGDLNTGYQEFIAPAALIIILFFVPLASGGVAYIQDKKYGTLDRSMVAGVTTVDVIAAFMVTEGSLILFQVLLSFVLMVFAFGVVIHGSAFLFFLICLLNGIAGLSLGFLIAMCVDEEMEAIVLVLGLYTPILILSGIIWPLEGIHPVVWYISHSLPSTYPTEAIRSIVNRGWGFTHPHVWPGFVTLLCWTVLCWILTAIVHKMKK